MSCCGSVSKGLGGVSLTVEEDIGYLMDAVLLCLEEKYFVNESLASWHHEIIPLIDKGVEVYRVVSYGIIREKLLLRDFLAVSYVARISEEELNPVETVLTLSNGRRIEVKPEVELERCLKRILMCRRSL